MAQENDLKLKKNTFTKALRGYSCEEVDTYMAYVQDKYGQVCRECTELRRKMTAMAAGQNEYRDDALRAKEEALAQADEIRTRNEAMLTEARRTAAKMLADAENAAEGLRRQAQAEADRIRENADAAARTAVEAAERDAEQMRGRAQEILAKAEEDARTQADTERIIRREQNRADRMVREIDTFRQQVFDMYAKHIGELERLAAMTDTFYQNKEALAESEELPEEPAGVPMYVTDEVLDGEEMEAVLRIDWKNHRAGAAAAAAAADAVQEEPWEETENVWEDAAPAGEAWTEETAGEPLEDQIQAEEPWNGTETWEDADTVSDNWETEPEVPEAWEDADGSPWEEGTDRTHWTDPEDETDQPWDEAGNEPEEAWDEPETEAAESVPETRREEKKTGRSADPSDEDLLSRLTAKYMTPPPAEEALPETAEAPAGEPDSQTSVSSLDELFYNNGHEPGEQEVSLTGEFEKIFSSKKSADYVAEIDKQPLVAAKRPEKHRKNKKNEK